MIYKKRKSQNNLSFGRKNDRMIDELEEKVKERMEKQ